MFVTRNAARRGGNDRIMMRRNLTPIDMRWAAILIAVLLAFAAGCASTPEATEDSGDVADSEFNDASNQPIPDSDMQDTDVSNRSFNIAPVYFELDQSEIRGEFGSILGSAATALIDSGATVVIAGHCDERGSDDYNVALGERRAGSVRNYLYNLGVPMAQMTIVSYGEAQPAVSGTGETAWQLNRRAEFQVR